MPALARHRAGEISPGTVRPDINSAANFGHQPTTGQPRSHDPPNRAGPLSPARPHDAERDPAPNPAGAELAIYPISPISPHLKTDPRPTTGGFGPFQPYACQAPNGWLVGNLWTTRGVSTQLGNGLTTARTQADFTEPADGLPDSASRPQEKQKVWRQQVVSCRPGVALASALSWAQFGRTTRRSNGSRPIG